MLKGSGIIEDWIEEGRAEEARRLITLLLREKFGELPDPVMERINRADARWCRRIGVKLLHARTLHELGL